MNNTSYFSHQNQMKLAVVIFIIAIFGIYGITLINNPIFFWDDDWMVINNNYIRSLSINNLFKIFTNTYYSQYSPLNTLFYAILYNIFGLDAFVFHAASIVLHLINSILVFIFIYKIDKFNDTKDDDSLAILNRRLYLSFLVAFFFAISPMQIETVAWISASKILLYALFFLTSLIFYISYLNTKKLLWLFASLFSFLLAMFSKEQAVVLPLMLLLIHYFISFEKHKLNYLTLLPFFFLALLFGIFSIRTQGYEFHNEMNTYYPLWQRIFLACYSLTQYIVKITFPLRQWLFYPFPIKPNESLPYFYLIYPVIVAVLGYVAYEFYRLKDKLFIFCIGFFFINLALTLHIIPMGRASILADRYVYIPLIGIFYILANYLLSFLYVAKLKRKAVIFFFFLYLSFTYYKSIHYIKEWDQFWLKSMKNS